MTIEELAVEVQKLRDELAALKAQVDPIIDSHKPETPMPFIFPDQTKELDS